MNRQDTHRQDRGDLTPYGSGPAEGQLRFGLLLDGLQCEMLEEHIAVSMDTNPVLSEAHTLERQQLETALTSYCRFPENIVSFLDATRSVAQGEGWTAIARELERNMGEELGSDSGGLSHYELLKKGLAEELDLTIPGGRSSVSTEVFIDAMGQHCSNSRSPEFAMGAIYACECSAVPELKIVKELANRLALVSTGSELDSDGALANFLAMHLDKWEPGHEEGLRSTCAANINTDDAIAEFQKGFRAVMHTMDQWWRGLTREARAEV